MNVFLKKEKLYNQFLRLRSFVCHKSGIKELKVILFMVLGWCVVAVDVEPFRIPPANKTSP